jgi:tripartite-type tricarboxylate transporter receptor subunit TctC
MRLSRRACLLAALPWPALAQRAWPVRALRILVAYPTGGISDQVARALADRLAVQLGTPVLVDNRPGAGGSLALQQLARSAPDGHALCFTAITALALLPAAPGGWQGQVVPVAGVMATPLLLVGTPALQAADFAGMLAEGRTREGGLRWASSGEGTTGHRVAERVAHQAGIAVIHVPYKGGGQQINDALGGQFEILSTNVGAQQIEAVRSGRLKALAVGAPARLAVLPGVPTLAELGFVAANSGSLFGLFAPAHTPLAVLDRLNAEVNAALRTPGLRTRLLRMDNVPLDGSAASFGQLIARQLGR